MNRQLMNLRGLNFSYYATNAALTPYLPIFFEARGYSSSQIGLLMMIGPFMAVFAQPFWGYVSDRLQRIKLFIGILWGLTILASVGLFQANSFPASLLFALLLYFFSIPSISLLDSMVIKAAGKYGVTYGSIRMWGSAGFAVLCIGFGYVLGWIGGLDSLKYGYWVLWLIPLLLLIPVKDEKRTDAVPVTFRGLKVLAGNRMFLWFLFMVLIVSIPHRMNDALLALYMTERGAPYAMVGWAWALAAASEVPVFAAMSRYLQRYHEFALLGIVSALYAVRWIVFSLVSSPQILMLLQLSHGITYALFWITAVHCATRLVPEQLRSTGQSLLSAVFLGVAGLTGGFTGGIIQEIWSSEAMYVFGGVMAGLAAALFFGTNAAAKR